MEFEGGIVPITYCKGGREARREALLNPPLPTDDDFLMMMMIKLDIKTSSLKTVQKFPATACSDIGFSSPLVF